MNMNRSTKPWIIKKIDFSQSMYVTKNRRTNAVKLFIYNNLLHRLPESDCYNKIDTLIMKYNLEITKLSTSDVNEMCKAININFSTFRNWCNQNYPKPSYKKTQVA